MTAPETMSGGDSVGFRRRQREGVAVSEAVAQLPLEPGQGTGAAQFQGAEDRHQPGLHLGARLGAVATVALAHQHRRADRPLALVVRGVDVLPLQEGQQFVVVLLEAARLAAASPWMLLGLLGLGGVFLVRSRRS